MIKNDIVIGFDFDGVIVNSLSVMEKSWNALSKKHNIAIPFSAYKKNIGLKFNKILENIGVEKSLFEVVEKDYFSGTKYYENEVQLYPEVIETLQTLKHNKIPTFIVTSKPRAHTMALIEIFKVPVDAVVCADDVNQGKPHTESGDLVKNIFGKKTFYYVGDMDSDRRFAENCNFNFIYAAYGYGTLSKTEGYKIESLSQTLKLL